MKSRSASESRWALAACTVAVAAAVGGRQTADQPNEAQAVQGIQQYCRASWRNAGIDQQEWPDCTQQAVTELIDRISPDGLPVAIHDNESSERRELNRAVWRIIQRCRRSPRHAPLEDPAEKSNPGTTQTWDEVELAASRCLSDRQRDILSRLRDGWRVQEIAGQLGISAARVSDEKYKAVHKLREALA